ncbi:MAG TPA: hypothetical protein DCZ35_02295, partial [Acidimicrobiaceae bacterium]|nr:hypothetical protein [Acidimicrobiaceae bacterium]
MDLADLADLAGRRISDPRPAVEAGPAGPERDSILDLLDTAADVLDRTCRPGHLTGSAPVVAAFGWPDPARFPPQPH